MLDGDSLSQHVEWWTSESISPLVQQCSINSKCLWICHDDSKMPAWENFIDPIYDDFFQLLPQFVNVRWLHCRNIVFTDLVLTQIYQLERLTTLEIDSCIMIVSIRPPTLKVINFLFKMSPLLLKYSTTQENQGWLEVSHPDHICCIHICIMIDNHPSGDLFTPVADSQVDLASLYQHVTMIVLHPTTLQELVITGWGEDVHLPKCRISLPSLRVYDGPSRLFEVLLTGEDLHTLTLHGDLWAALCQPELRLQLKLIEQMELHVDTFSLADVEVIKRMGIRINHLGMHAIFSDSDTVSSFIMFAISTCLMFPLQMFALNKVCPVPGLGVKTLFYSYLYLPWHCQRLWPVSIHSGSMFRHMLMPQLHAYIYDRYRHVRRSSPHITNLQSHIFQVKLPLSSTWSNRYIKVVCR